MAFSKDSPLRPRQSPVDTIHSPSCAASIPPIRAHKILDPLQTITPPQEKDTPLPDSQIEPLDQTDEALTYLRDLFAGRCRGLLHKVQEFRLPARSWIELVTDPEFKIPDKISYDASKSILTIFTMPGERHGRILDWAHELAVLAKHKLNSSVRRNIVFKADVDFSRFENEWDGSQKAPDLAIAWIQDFGGTSLHTVVEVGSSQSRDSPLGTLNLYLKGAPEISRVVLINIIETPQYVSPEKINIDELGNIQTAEFRVDSERGPLWYKGIQWVGQIAISWEVWERDPTSGEPKQVFEETIIPNDSESRLPFFEIPTTIAAGVEAVTVKPADIQDLWHDRLRDAIIDEAKFRMRVCVKGMIERAEDAADIAKQKDQAREKRQKDNEERTERLKRRIQV